MDFSLLKQIVDSINNTVANTGVAAVKSLRNNLFSVKVTNPVTKVDVKGQVTVANQKNVEQLIKDLRKTTVEFSKKTHNVKVSNWQTPQSLSNLEQNIKEVTKSVEKLVPELQNVAKEAKQVKTDSVEVSNQPITELKAVLEALKSLDLKVKALKLDPTINVKAPIIPAPIVNVSPTPITVEKEEPDYETMVRLMNETFFKKDATHYMPVRLSDGKLFYEAITKISGGISQISKQKQEREYDSFIDVDGLDTYLCDAEVGTSTNKTGWRIIRITDNGDGTKVTRYADGSVSFDKIADNRYSYSYEIS